MSRAGGWIRRNTRLAVWLRDGFACVYCSGQGPDVALSLDHIGDRDDHATSNLVTACVPCNSSRKEATLGAFCKAQNLDRSVVWKRINTRRNQPIAPYQSAVNTMAKRGFPVWLQAIAMGLQERDFEPATSMDDNTNDLEVL